MARQRTEEVTIEEGRRALLVGARLVDLYGEIYLPLFERLEAEFMELQRRGSAVERALALAREPA
jgi:hypothetical protein